MIKQQKIQHFAVLIGLVSVTLALTGCGVKPRAVDPPAHVTTDTFPHVYPPVDADLDQPDRYLPPGYTPQQQTETPTSKAPTP